ncbi:hypothetical protein [Salinibacterium sp. ZJ70]|uniref:hypothetical protein n=1 Tax=Salinibacterium sp. ZJ70 TaxID=2708084 RepID=UPI00141DDD20|nr:hypothetical protein [Salinibacterium sp. ZJ70]
MAVLTGCVAAGSSELAGGDHSAPEVTLTLADAREITLERQQEIASYFPAEFTADTRTTETTPVIYPCGGENNFQWPVVTIITITGEPPHEQIIEAIVADWSGRSGWTLERSTSSKGFPKVTLNHEDGSSFLAGFYASGAEFWVDSYSPCFHHPAGYEYGERY